ncbi:FAD-dependent oxidoreductase [Actinomadura sp. 9N215]|uniref:FAD-dependent oxidoreductase n=1 Tax=Actinomadura sp. 9N215 TaxID=3375150 RepID=UPI00379EB540
MADTSHAHAIVLGGSMAGMLAAHVLARHVGTVTVVERDVLPDGPHQRRGLPQARHVHLLWSGGARIIEELLPGTTDRLKAAGARLAGVHRDMLSLTSHGWQHRFDSPQFAVMCSRPLLDWVIRDRICTEGRVRVRRGEAAELAGDAHRVTGVRVRDVTDGSTAELDADLVVDATGRGSRLGQWLSALGAPPLDKDVVDSGMGYSTRVFKAPPGATAGFPVVNVLSDHRVDPPSCNGTVYPIEGDRWMVTLSGTRGTELPSREEEFVEYAYRLRHPIIGDLIRDAEPLTTVFRSYSGINRRLYPERLDRWPDGLVVLGDSLAAFNPLYGHGMSAAARAARALDGWLAGPWTEPGAALAAQHAIGEVVDDPWIMATSRDICYAGCRNHSTDHRLTEGADALRSFTEIVATKTIRAPAVSAVVTDVTSLSAPQSELGTSRFVSLMQRDALMPELTEPPLHPDELALVALDPARKADLG